MKILARTLIFLIIASAFVSFGVTSTSAQVTLDSFDAKAGDTVWYKADSFTMDLNFLSDGAINDTYMTSTLDFSGSQLFAKVMNVVPMTGSFYDPATDTSSPGSSKVVDLATGVILGKDVPFTLDNFSTTIPSGVGVPIPSIFQSNIEFNFQPDEFTNGFFPLYLSDNWADHEAYFTALADSSLFITNDAAQFKVDQTQPFMRYNNNTGTDDKIADVALSVAWSKDNNLVSSASLKVSDSTNTYVDISIVFTKVENNGLDLEVGDVFNIGLTTGTLDLTLEGDAWSQSAQDGVNQAKQQLADAVAVNTLLQITVDKVDGLYYLTTINEYNMTTDTMDFVASQWFAGFGNLQFDYFLQAGSNMQNQGVVTGPATTPDNYIWGSWDASTSFLFGVLEAQFDTLVQTTKDQAFNDSSVTQFDLTATLKLGHSVDTSNGYSVTSTEDISASFTFNSTNEFSRYDWNGTDLVLTNITEWNYIDGSLAMNGEVGYSYDVRGRLSDGHFKLSGFIDIATQYFNGTTVDSSSGKITLTNLELVMNTNFVPATPETDPPTNNPAATSTGATTPSLPLPGFEMFVALGSIALVAVVFRKRRT